MLDRQRFGRMFFILAAIGLLTLARAMNSPSFETIRAVDVVLLIAAGMCFGAGIMALVLSRRRASATS